MIISSTIIIIIMVVIIIIIIIVMQGAPGKRSAVVRLSAGGLASSRARELSTVDSILYIYIYIEILIYIYIYTFTYVYTYVYTCWQADLWAGQLAGRRVYAPARPILHGGYVYIYIYICIYAYISISLSLSIYIYIYTYTYTRTLDCAFSARRSCAQSCLRTPSIS